MPASRTVVLVLAPLALLAAGFAFLRPSTQSSPDERYEDAVRAMCTASDRSIRHVTGGYFAIVVSISDRKARELSAIAPPADRRRLHAQLIAGERALALRARQLLPATTQQQLAAFHPMRAEQARLESRYRTLGIVGCSN